MQEQVTVLQVMESIVNAFNELKKHRLTSAELTISEKQEIISDKFIVTNELKVGDQVIASQSIIDPRTLEEIKQGAEQHKAAIEAEMQAKKDSINSVITLVEGNSAKSK